MDLLLAFMISMIVTMTLIPPLMRAAGPLHVLDQPGQRKVHTTPVPRVGGVAMAIGVFVPLLLWLPLERLLAAYLAASLVMILFGVWDDRANLSVPAKFLGQLIAVFIVVYGGDVTISSLTLTERHTIPDAIAMPLSILFLLGVTNAINFADGLDGLAGGTTLLACCAIAVLGITVDMPFVSTIALVVSGSILGFLRFNTYPARIFMGDGGSQFLGFTVGVLSVVLTQRVEAPLSAALPLLLLGLPILDTVTVMALRIYAGRSPFQADKKHIHHKLLALGFDHHEAVYLIYGAQALMFLAAWFLRFASDLLIVATFALFAGAILALLLAAERLGWYVRSPSEPRRPSALARMRAWLAAIERMPRWTLFAAAVCAIAYASCVAVSVGPVPTDVRWLACGLAVVLGFVAVRGGGKLSLDWLAQGALYVAAVIAVYLDHQSTVDSPILQTVKWIVFPLLVAAVVLRMRLSGERRFRLTPLDALLIFVALALPNLPGLTEASSRIGISVAKLVALLYAVEMISSNSQHTRRLAWVGAFAFCSLLVVYTFAPHV